VPSMPIMTYSAPLPHRASQTIGIESCLPQRLPLASGGPFDGTCERPTSDARGVGAAPLPRTGRLLLVSKTVKAEFETGVES
jgi:hypothetical protein